jgi:hypothetical protein
MGTRVSFLDFIINWVNNPAAVVVAKAKYSTCAIPGVFLFLMSCQWIWIRIEIHLSHMFSRFSMTTVFTNFWNHPKAIRIILFQSKGTPVLLKRFLHEFTRSFSWDLDSSWNTDTDYCTWLDKLNGTRHCHLRCGIGISDKNESRGANQSLSGRSG